MAGYENINGMSFKKSGERISAEEYNAMLRALKGNIAIPGGYVSENGITIPPQLKSLSRWFEFVCADDVPAYSLFGITGVDSPNKGDPVRVSVAMIGAASANVGSHYLLATNGQIAIPSGSIGLARLINDFDTARVQVTGSAPSIGGICGPDLDNWGVSSDRYGLVCLATDGSYAEVMRVAEMANVVGRALTKITAFNQDEFKLGTGSIEVLARVYDDENDPTLEAVSDAVSGATNWPVPVFNLGQEIAKGEIVIAKNALSVGLVISRTDNPGSSSSSVSDSSDSDSQQSDSDSQQSDSSTSEECASEVGGVPIHLLPGFDVFASRQYLVVEEGCVKLISPNQCQTSSGSG